MGKQTYQQRSSQDARIPVGQRRTEGGKVLEDNRAAFNLGATQTASPLTEQQPQLATMSQTSPAMAAQRSVVESVNSSPYVTVQRQRLDNLTGGSARQLKEELLPEKVESTQRVEVPAAPNNTGLPDQLKSGIESLSGLSMDNVKVHYNSAKPAQLNALAYAQGTDIHVGPGQEKHLPHEAWHVVQQAQGRVKPTMQMKDGQPVNNDKNLEAEADVMGEKGANEKSTSAISIQKKNSLNQPIQKFVPDATTNEPALVTTALDTLLGNGNDPGGARAAITTNAADLARLQAAVNTIIVTAAVPLGDVPAFLTDFGNDVELLAGRLTQATLASGAGTPGLRLRRVIDENPLTPRTAVDLDPLINDKKNIDEKILRGRVNGRDLIGGHSQGITNNPDYAISNTVNNPNGTDYVSFRKLLRADTAGFANAVNTGAGGNIVASINTLIDNCNAVRLIPLPMFNPKMPAHIIAQKTTTHTNGVLGINAAVPAAQNDTVAIQHAAPAAAAGVANATAQAPFFDAVMATIAHMLQLFTHTEATETIVGGNVGSTSRAAFNTLIDNFINTGPSLSANKNSTFAPAGMTDDQILQAGDQTAAVPATLIRDRPNHNIPVDNTRIETMHQLVIGNVVWVATKDNVLYRSGPPPSLTGGTVTSAFPTQQTVIPPDPAPGAANGDGFGPLV